MTRRSHRDEQRAVEDTAAAAAAFVLGVKARRIDKGRGQRVRDFDLIFDDDIEPLEVTQHVHQPTREALARLDAEGMGFDKDSPGWWFVGVPYTHTTPRGTQIPLDVRRCEQELKPLLALLEDLGITRFETAGLFLDDRLRPFADAMTTLGIDAGQMLPGAKGLAGHVTLIPGGGGAFAADMIADAVEIEANDRGNRNKLAALASAPRRHLFVPIDLSAGLTYSAARQAFEFGGMPRLPTLPPEITTAWVSVGRNTELLVVTPPAPWEAHRVPLDVRDHPERWIVE